MIICTLIGAFIGAGFASGQEIYTFFYRYKKLGIIGIILCSFILGYIIYKVLNIVYKNKINTYKQFLELIFKNNLKLSKINNIFINLFLCISFFIMISGFGSYFNQEFGINNIIGSTILAIISYLIFLKNIKSITKINSIIIPILIILVFIIGIKNILTIDVNQIGKNIILKNGQYFIIQSILYASYNLILLIPVIVNLKKYIKNKRNIVITSILTSTIICIMTILIFLLLTNIDNFNKINMPAVYVIKTKFKEFRLIYGIIILTAIFTTAISIGISFLNNICKKDQIPKKAFLLCLTSVIVSKIKFSALVNILFPLFGYLGLLQIYFILKNK